mgnify:CR=1 FL=1
MGDSRGSLLCNSPALEVVCQEAGGASLEIGGGVVVDCIAASWEGGETALPLLRPACTPLLLGVPLGILADEEI